jgi:hypothetical protein
MEALQQVFRERLDYLTRLADQKYAELLDYIRKQIPYESGVSISQSQGWTTVSYQRKFRKPTPVGCLKPFQTTYTPPKVTITPINIPLPPPEEVPQVEEITGITEIPPPEKVSISLQTLKQVNIPDVNITSIPLPPNYASQAFWESMGIVGYVAAAIGYNPYAWWDPLLGTKAIIVTASLYTAIKIGEALQNLYDNYIKPVFITINNQVIGNPSSPATYSLNWALDQTKNQIENTINNIIGDPANPANGTLNYLIKYGIGVPADNPPPKSLNWILAKLHKDIATPLYNLGKDIKVKLQNTANSLVDKINNSIRKLHGNTQAALNALGEATAKTGEVAINTAVQKIYELMGMLTGMGMTPAVIQPLENGFRWWSPTPGATLLYIVVEGELI